MTKYVCLLRGINVGGKTIRMENLKEVFTSLGFTDVSTLLTSGNVVFSSKESNLDVLTKEIELALKRAFNTDISVILRVHEYIQELVKSEPFKSITVTPGVRLHVTFLKEKTRKTLVIPYHSPQKDFDIISATSDEIFLVVHEGGQTTDAMTFLEKQFGKRVTTRTWNTIKKISMVQ